VVNHRRDAEFAEIRRGLWLRVGVGRRRIAYAR
jgi:hypothetical protein